MKGLWAFIHVQMEITIKVSHNSRNMIIPLKNLWDQHVLTKANGLTSGTSRDMLEHWVFWKSIHFMEYKIKYFQILSGSNRCVAGVQNVTPRINFSQKYFLQNGILSKFVTRITLYLFSTKINETEILQFIDQTTMFPKKFWSGKESDGSISPGQTISNFF